MAPTNVQMHTHKHSFIINIVHHISFDVNETWLSDVACDKSHLVGDNVFNQDSNEHEGHTRDNITAG